MHNYNSPLDIATRVMAFLGATYPIALAVAGFLVNNRLAEISQGVQELRSSAGLVTEMRSVLGDTEADSLARASSRAYLMHRLNDQTDAAIEKMRAIVEVAQGVDNDREATAWYSLGTIYQDIGAYDEARNAYSEAIALRIDYSEAYGNRALVNVELEEYDQALTDHEATTTLRPNDPQAFLNRAELYLQLMEYDLARADVEVALRLARDEERQDRIDEAQALMEKIPSGE